MNIAVRASEYLVAMTNEERAALVWALETGRALLLGDPNLSVLAAEDEISPDLLDVLADRLFLAGCAPPRRAPKPAGRA